MRKILFLSLLAAVFAFSIWSSNAYAYAIEISTSDGSTVCPEISGSWDAVTDTCSTSGLNLGYGSSLQVDQGVILSVSFSSPHFGQILAQEGLDITNHGTINFTKDGTLVLSPHDFVENTGTINFYNNGELDYAGNFENNGTINFYGNCDSPCINNADFNDVFTNIGKINFHGPASAKTVDIQNFATFNNTQAQTNAGRFVGNITLDNGGSIYNTGTFENDFDIYVVNNGNITNQGTFGGAGYIDFPNAGNLNNGAGKTFTIKDAVNAHNVFNHGIMNITSSDSSSLLISGNLTNYAGGTINVGGFIGLDSGSAYLLNSGTIDIVPNGPDMGASGEIIDAGPTVYNYCDGRMESILVTPYPIKDACDTAPPVTTATLSGTTGANGWYTSPVSVALAATDDLSGVASTSYSLDGSRQVPYTGEIQVTGNGTHILTFNSTDKTGNAEPTNTLSVKIDNMPPVVTGTANMTSNSDGWYNHPMQISWAGTDVTSGIASCDNPATYSGPDDSSVTITGHCTDNAGNVGTSAVTIKYDSSRPMLVVPPNISAIFPTSPLGAAVTFSDSNGTAATATDATSGVASISYSPPSGSTFPIGTTTVTVTATDNAGNTAVGIFTVTVLAPSQAMQQAIDNIASMNLDHGISNSLDVKLTSAIASLNSGNDTAANGQLEAFINEVNAQAGKKITHSDADQLAYEVQDIMNSIR